MNLRFEVDAVRLKSRGGDMTVRSFDGDMVICEWWDKGKVRRADFPSAMLNAGGEFADLRMLAMEGVTHTPEEFAEAISGATCGDLFIAASCGSA